MTAQTGLRRVAVDLTGLEPGGANGGAGVVAVSLVRQLSRLAPGMELVLLTASRGHAELAALDGPNVRRICVLPQPDAGRPVGEALVRARHDVRDRLRHIVGPRRLARMRELYWRIRYERVRSSTLRNIGAELYFCPLTSAFCSDPAIPRVSIIYDLQHQRLPAFFTVEQRIFRQQQHQDAVEHSTRLVCISDHVRRSVLDAWRIDPSRAVTVHLPVLQPVESVPASEAQQVALRLGLETDRFLLYPSNFWPHKNHERLLAAFAAFRQSSPESALRLVLSGVVDARGQAIRQRVAELDLGARVTFAGYVSSAELTALLQTCRALIYPSLYEGFGMPVLEAMACGKAVLCSRAGSLPEVGGDVAVYFDADDIGSMCSAIAWVDGQAAEVRAVAARGRARAASFGTPEQMAQRYLALFEEALVCAARC